jgi:arylformamidase
MRPAKDAAWHDAQYNNRARIPEHREILQAWSDDSAATRQRLRGTLDVPYGAHPSETLDLFHPVPRRAPGAGGAPVLVYLHGGYWRALDKRDQSFVAEPLVEAGALVVLPNYALCPAVTVEHIVRQMLQALVWVHDHVAQHGGDPGRIVVAGHSAGGHLAAMLLACRWPLLDARLPARLVHGALSLSGVFDLEPLRHAPFLAPDLQLDAASARKLSPCHVLPPAAGTLVALVGAQESEEFLRQNRLIRRAWGARAVPVCEAVAARHHMNILADLCDPASLAHRAALRLLGLGGRADGA